MCSAGGGSEGECKTKGKPNKDSGYKRGAGVSGRENDEAVGLVSEEK